MTLEEIKEYLKTYDGDDINIMEVCGSHTDAISKNGIPQMLSKKIHLLSGPGCPVCVTPSSYIDRLIELSKEPDTVIATFGDLIRVPGSEKSLSDAKGEGAQVLMVYSPLDIIRHAKEHPEKTYVFAAVGFETTTPVYATLMDRLIDEDIKNVKLLTAIKTMPQVIDHLLKNGAPIDAFIAPGHVSVVTGYGIFEPIAEKYGIPFGVSGFQGNELLIAIYGIVRHVGRGVVKNYYPSVVTKAGNETANEMVDKYFVASDATWRGMGEVPGSGRLIASQYSRFDAGSADLNEDHKKNAACRCDQILMGKMKPYECPLFGKVCTPMTPQGACMVSTEGSCFSYLSSGRQD
ncbi:MAG: hydrogenase formation protein HypD [Lachnospiraceae bacterium]|nr:hydrogenase formation protein HypD [Lachnospiraceae bacterium]